MIRDAGITPYTLSLSKSGIPFGILCTGLKHWSRSNADR